MFHGIARTGLIAFVTGGFCVALWGLSLGLLVFFSVWIIGTLCHFILSYFNMKQR